MRKIFVLDTNVLLHDPQAIFKFGGADVFIPWLVLEELDMLKQGDKEINRTARSAVQVLAQLSNRLDAKALNAGISLSGASDHPATGSLFFQSKRARQSEATQRFSSANDNQLIQTVMDLAHGDLLGALPAGSEVRLVSLDLNLRIKAAAVGIAHQDYLEASEGSSASNANVRTSRIHRIDAAELKAAVTSRVREGDEHTERFYAVPSRLPDLALHDALLCQNKIFRVTKVYADSLELTPQIDYCTTPLEDTRLRARNTEQAHAIGLLMDPDLDLVVLNGPAGSGKSLLAIACGLALVDARRMENVLVTRAAVSLSGEDTPAQAQADGKSSPWLGAIHDCLDVLIQSRQPALTGSLSSAATKRDTARVLRDQLMQDIEVRSVMHMRGRSFANRFFIIDEAQNLTPHQIKALISRAGAGTKVVVLGNLDQIDTPYMSPRSSGLSNLLGVLPRYPRAAAATLGAGERSALANFANTEL
jgi:PhoH-like ATPase